MVVARTPLAFNSLQEQFRRRVVWKTYLALAWGRVTATEGRLSWPLGRHPKEGSRMSVRARSPKTGRDVLPGPAGVQGHDPARGQAGHRPDPSDPGPSGRGRPSGRRRPRLRAQAGAPGVPAHLPPRPHPVVRPPFDRRAPDLRLAPAARPRGGHYPRTVLESVTSPPKTRGYSHKKPSFLSSG